MLGGHAADRTTFLGALDASLARDAGAVAVARIDLDRFSRLRQVRGPAVFRYVKSVIAARVKDAVGGQEEHVLRYGEDAFIVLLTVPDGLAETLEAIGMDIVDSVSSPIEVKGGRPCAVGCNVGIAAAASFEDLDSLRLVSGAELAVQRANTIGSRRVIVYELARRGDPTRLPQLFADMLDAVEDSCFRPVFQPIVSVPDRRIRGAEALVRWQHPVHGILTPAEFIDEAETSGLIRQIDSQIRRLAFIECKGWPDNVELTLSVNLSAADLDSPGLPDDVAAGLAAAGVPASRLVLEVTETALSQDWSRARRRLTALKDLGVRLAVDDFGSGHMYLDRLSTGLFDVLKIDRSLVAPEAGNGHRSSALLAAVASMGRELGMQVVAEGVETVEQLERVVEAGCDRAQGYLFSPPIPAEVFARVAASPDPL
jgi:EAL domain-containing protein (putative c-di-GMP-specific phosphodiesterase class I)/GGDEF domain-containing protein